MDTASERSKPALLGGSKEVSPTNSEVQEAAKYAVEQLSSQSNSLFPLKLEQAIAPSATPVHGAGCALQLRQLHGLT